MVIKGIKLKTEIEHYEFIIKFLLLFMHESNLIQYLTKTENAYSIFQIYGHLFICHFIRLPEQYSN